ncbi:hypothetical protein BC936DRAFT_146397 [Jimgerdemannia flammicorona]|uniref:Par3/HAL N-terminal domain-containing protein n=1 Tax=Jimgerdemannia flammicorona TaxID=994334 RepID=A0A433DLM2_9FUNG|nr:hypothetical protein BC936DRAFT_146397 [Jimgerdemannia flammicorona]
MCTTCCPNTPCISRPTSVVSTPVLLPTPPRNPAPPRTEMKRVKVSWNGTKLVVPCGIGSDRVSRLLNDITHRFQKHAGDLDQANYFVELRTSDGYLLDKSDTIESVVENGDEIEVIDYKAWIENFKKNAELEIWGRIDRQDFVDDVNKYVGIFALGVHGCFSSTAYSHTSLGNESAKFKVYDSETLSLTKPGVLDEIHGDDTSQTWYCSAHWDLTNSIEIRVKSTSDFRAQIVKVEFRDGIIAPRFKVGAITTSQTSYPAPRTTSYVLPALISEGPALKEDGYTTPIDIKAVEVKSMGESALRLQQIGKPFVEQYWSGYRGAFQRVNVEFRVTNTSEETASVVNIVAEYLDHDGNWAPATVRSGQKASEYWYDIKCAHDTFLPFEPKATSKLSLQFETDIDPTKYKSLDNRIRRIHTSLPDPLHVRFTLIDQHNRTSIITIQAVNGPPNVPTRASYESEFNCSLHHWIQCDDMVSDERLFIPIKHVEEGGERVLEIGLKPMSTTYRVDQNRLRRWAWEAVQKGVEEVWLEDVDWSAEDNNFGLKMACLVALEDQVIYGLKVMMWTQTGKVEECFEVPLELYT